MKFTVLKSRKRSWTNRTNRALLGVTDGDYIYVSFGDKKLQTSIQKAPKNKLGVIKLAEQTTEFPVIVLEPKLLASLGIEPGAEVEVTKATEVYATQSDDYDDSCDGDDHDDSGNDSEEAEEICSDDGVSSKPKTNKQKLNALKVGQCDEFSESYVKSGVYTHAKELGIKVKKVGPSSVQRVS